MHAALTQQTPQWRISATISSTEAYAALMLVHTLPNNFGAFDYFFYFVFNIVLIFGLNFGVNFGANFGVRVITFNFGFILATLSPKLKTHKKAPKFSPILSPKLKSIIITPKLDQN